MHPCTLTVDTHTPTHAHLHVHVPPRLVPGQVEFTTGLVVHAALTSRHVPRNINHQTTRRTVL